MQQWKCQFIRIIHGEKEQFVDTDHEFMFSDFHNLLYYMKILQKLQLLEQFRHVFRTGRICQLFHVTFI